MKLSWSCVGCSSGLLERSWASPGALLDSLGASWGSLGALWEPLGAICALAVVGSISKHLRSCSKRFFEASLERLSWGPLVTSLCYLRAVLDALRASWRALGPLLRLSWMLLGPLGTSCSWGSLGASSSYLGGLLEALGASWSSLGASWSYLKFCCGCTGKHFQALAIMFEFVFRSFA